ncbi:hypothetical protein [Streptomyces umbrinus]|uniref:hypothetical protein n=1 Tax=Streptomyces umbrinus TaxID=67370 RepID=UPI0033F6FFB9
MHRELDGTYGVPRTTAELREADERVNHGAGPRPGWPLHHSKRAEHEVRRQHNLSPAGRGGKFLYLATVINLASRRLGRLGDREPHAHRPRHRRSVRRKTDPRQPRRSGHAHRPRGPIHQPGNFTGTRTFSATPGSSDPDPARWTAAK